MMNCLILLNNSIKFCLIGVIAFNEILSEHSDDGSEEVADL